MSIHTRLHKSVDATEHQSTLSFRDNAQVASIPFAKKINSLPPEKASTRSFSQVSRRDVMLSNLENGIQYTNLQISSLSECSKLIILMRSSSFSCSPHSQELTDNQIHNSLFIDTIASLSETKHMGLPLFGFGHEPPIKVHLRINEKIEAFHFQVSDLMGQHSINGLINSKNCKTGPSTGLLDQANKDVLSLMLKAESISRCASNKVDLVKKRYSDHVLIKRAPTPSSTRCKSFFAKRIFHKFLPVK